MMQQRKKERKRKMRCSMTMALCIFLSCLMMLYLCAIHTIMKRQNNDENMAAIVNDVLTNIKNDSDNLTEVKIIHDSKIDQGANKERMHNLINNSVFNSQVQIEAIKATPVEVPDAPKSATVSQQQPKERPKLKAYIEKIDQSIWKIKPLPARRTKANDLEVMEFDNVSSCKRLPEQWPVDENDAPTNKDPFLPWIHDIFPTADGKYIQFVAQNKRRCQTGKKQTDIKTFMQPNVAIFQHVPIKRVQVGLNSTETRYRLTSHEDADPDGIETRFICRFKPSMEETLSVFNFNYDFHTLRKSYKASFTEEGFDNHMIWSSQFLFRCPVPESLQETVKSGSSVSNDYASLFVDLIPIRTPPRFGPPTTYLPPRLFDEKNTWDVEKEWGSAHILPSIEDSGRWENIPICKPSLMTYPDEAEMQSTSVEDDKAVEVHDKQMTAFSKKEDKKHELIACTWTSAAFKTRGGRTSVNDGSERLRQWLEFNRLVGVDHVYIYDNSGAFSNENDLKPITDLFPGYVTRINWPATVCNNNRGNADNKGERSSQYAADASCRLRFGAHTKWLASYDTDEYLVPMSNYTDLKHLLRDVESKDDIRVLNFQSKRSKPRMRYLDTKFPGKDMCTKTTDCLDPSLKPNQTFLEVYNCNNEKPPRKVTQPAEKVIYKPDFVLQFFVHYATVTTLSATGKKESKDRRWFTRHNTRRHARFVDEEVEGTMLHTKAVVAKETNNWHQWLTNFGFASHSLVGVEWPETSGETDKTQVQIHGESFYPNCYPVKWIQDYWSPKLSEAIKHRKNNMKL